MSHFMIQSLILKKFISMWFIYKYPCQKKLGEGPFKTKNDTKLYIVLYFIIAKINTHLLPKWRLEPRTLCIIRVGIKFSNVSLALKSYYWDSPAVVGFIHHPHQACIYNCFNLTCRDTFKNMYVCTYTTETLWHFIGFKWEGPHLNCQKWTNVQVCLELLLTHKPGWNQAQKQIIILCGLLVG